MKIIVDTNLVFSSILKKENVLKFVTLSNHFELYSCHFMFVEIFKHKERILTHSKLNEYEISLQFYKVLNKIRFVNDEVIPNKDYLKPL